MHMPARPLCHETVTDFRARDAVGGGPARSEIEEFTEDRLLLLRPIVAAVVLPARVVGGCRRDLLRRRRRALDDLVKLATVEPDAPAFGAIVDLDALTVGHDKFASVDRALHGFASCHLLSART